MEMSFTEMMRLITKRPVVDHRSDKQENMAAPSTHAAGDGSTPSAGYLKRREAQRYVINAISRAQGRAITDGFPKLGEAYYDAITVLLEHWKPEASDNATEMSHRQKNP